MPHDTHSDEIRGLPMISRSLLKMAMMVVPVLVLMAGCSDSRDNGFHEVQQTVSDRTGQQIHWTQGGSEDAAVAARVDELLKSDMTTTSAVQIALLNNRSLQVTYEDLGIARADLVRAGLLRNPILDINAKFAVGGGVRVEATLVEDFLSILYLPLHKRIAESAFAGAKLRVTESVMDLCARVRTAVYQYQMAAQLCAWKRQDVAASSAAYELAEHLRAAGNITILDLAQHRDDFEQSKLSLNDLELQEAEAREQLTSTLGLWGHDLTWKAQSELPELPDMDPPAKDLEHLAIAKSLDLAAIKTDIIQAADLLGIARPMAVLDGTGIGAAAEREYDGVWGAGPYLSIPIPIFNMGQPAQLAAQSQLRRAEAMYFAQAVEIRNRVNLQWQRVASDRSRTQYVKQVVIPLRLEELKQAQLQYNGMLMSPFQLLMMKQHEIDAHAEYDRALASYWMSRTLLDEMIEGSMPMTTRSDPRGDMMPPMASSPEGRH